MHTVFDPRQLRHAPSRELHNGDWVDYAESASRPDSILAALGSSEPATDHGLDGILRVHSRDYVDFLATAWQRWIAAGRKGDAIGYTWPIAARRDVPLDRIDALLGRYSYDASTPITAGTWDAAYWSAQVALTALQPVLGGVERSAFALCRPPGHHAGPDYLGGYCYLNNAAIAAQAAVDAGRRVAILDVDYHHGNGTQHIFLESPDVLFVSIHADPRTDYPFYWGHSDERGAGAGEGATLNLPLPQGTAGADYRKALAVAVNAIRAHGPDVLVVSFGADTFEGDPISSFALTRADYQPMAAQIAALDLPTLVVMEGGYAVSDLGVNVAAFLSGF